jgi:hypothetical protein
MASIRRFRRQQQKKEDVHAGLGFEGNAPVGELGSSAQPAESAKTLPMGPAGESSKTTSFLYPAAAQVEMAEQQGEDVEIVVSARQADHQPPDDGSMKISPVPRVVEAGEDIRTICDPLPVLADYALAGELPASPLPEMPKGSGPGGESRNPQETPHQPLLLILDQELKSFLQKHADFVRNGKWECESIFGEFRDMSTRLIDYRLGVLRREMEAAMATALAAATPAPGAVGMKRYPLLTPDNIAEHITEAEKRAKLEKSMLNMDDHGLQALNDIFRVRKIMNLNTKYEKDKAMLANLKAEFLDKAAALQMGTMTELHAILYEY